jgi:uncharacterized protein (DUF58 family)
MDSIKGKSEKIPAELFRKIKKIEIRTRILVNEAITGGYSSVFRGYGMEFEEVREYFPGDDYRSIDWNVTARHSKPYVKRYKEERQMNTLLLIDSSGSLCYGSSTALKSDKLTETAAVLAFTALSNQDKIGAIFFTNEIEKVIHPSKNKNTVLRLVRELLFFKPKNKGTDINRAIDYSIETMKRRGIIFILSDFYSNVDFKKVYIASKKHDIIPVIFEDDFEEMPVNLGLVDMIDNETGQLSLIDTSANYYKKAIEERKDQKIKLFKELEKLKIEPMIINTKNDIDRIIMLYFKKRLKKIRL